MPGGTYFFPVTLPDRYARTLAERIDALRMWLESPDFVSLHPGYARLKTKGHQPSLCGVRRLRSRHFASEE